MNIVTRLGLAAIAVGIVFLVYKLIALNNGDIGLFMTDVGQDLEPARQILVDMLDWLRALLPRPILAPDQ